MYECVCGVCVCVCVCTFMFACMCGGQITLVDIYQVPRPVGSSKPLFLGHRVRILPSLFPLGSPATVSSGCLASLGSFLPLPQPVLECRYMPPRGGLQSQDGTVASQLCILWDAVGKVPVVHGPSSWLLCDVTCTFSFGSIEVDTLIRGPGDPLRRKGHQESFRGRYIWESQVT